MHIQLRHKAAEQHIGGQKAHIGRSLIKIAHQRIHQMLSLAVQSTPHALDSLSHHGMHQILLQLLKALPRRGHHGQQR